MTRTDKRTARTAMGFNAYDKDPMRNFAVKQTEELKRQDSQIAELRAALLAFVQAAKDVQEHWSDPGSYTHNRLLTPMLVHEHTILSCGQPDT